VTNTLMSGSAAESGQITEISLTCLLDHHT